MAPEEQRIAIAEECGWKWENPKKRIKQEGRLISPDFKKVCKVWKDGSLGGVLIPDHLNDLNAIHEAEETLTDEQFPEFDERLANTCGWLHPHKRQRHVVSRATAAQRAEAFLRTRGKWKESNGK
jgi:hypothetical protein